MINFDNKIKEILDNNRIYSESTFVVVSVEEMLPKLKEMGVIKATVVPPRTETYRDKQGVVRRCSKQIELLMNNNTKFWLELDSAGQRICIDTVIALEDLQWVNLRSEKYNVDKACVHIK